MQCFTVYFDIQILQPKVLVTMADPRQLHVTDAITKIPRNFAR